MPSTAPRGFRSLRMSIRPTLLLILAVTMGISMWITYNLTEKRSQLDVLENDVKNGFDDAIRIRGQIELYMRRLFLITDLASIEQISHGPVLLSLITDISEKLPQLVEETEQTTERILGKLKSAGIASDSKRLQEEFDSVSVAFSELNSVLIDYETAADLFIGDGSIGHQPLRDVTKLIVVLNEAYQQALDDFMLRATAIAIRADTATLREWKLYGVVALILLAAFIYGASNAIAAPLERLSLASKSAMPPGGEFKFSKGEFRFKEEQILATAIESLVAARNEQEQDLEAKVSRRDAELAHLNGMDQLGEVVGNVAHEFSNLLTIVLGYTEVSLKKGDLPEDLKKNLEQILTAANLGKGVTEQLLKLSRRTLDQSQPTSISLPQFIEEMEPLWKPFLGSRVNMEVKLVGESTEALIEEQKLSQIIMNLVTNARDAMPEGGTVQITVRNCNTGTCGPLPGPLDPARQYSVIEVKDDGCGIPESMRNKLYQPYETTKEKGHGTGFGLAIVHNMVVAAGGWIDFTTEADVGTTFRVWLPQVEQRQPVSVDGARLLLIEDEESIREIAILALEAEGYHVTAAPNGLVAIDSHEENLAQFDAVISDIRMPGMDGDRVVERFRKRRKSLPVLFISGHSFRKIEENLDSTCPTLFLQKPFTTMELNHRVRELLELTAE